MRRGIGWALGGAAWVALLSGSASGRLEMVERGVKGGLNFASLVNGVETDERSGLVFAVGGFMTYQVNEKVAFQPEVFYSMKGGEDTALVGGGVNERNVVTTWELTYLECQTLVKYTMPIGGKVKPVVFAGPSLGLNIGDDVVVEDPRDGNTTTAINANTFELGAILGAGAEIELPKGKLTVDARFNFGLTDMVDDDTHDNKVISIMVGYAF